MDDAEDDNIKEDLQGHLHYATARLQYDQRIRDTLVGELAEVEQTEGAAPVDLLVALERAEQAVLAAEAEVFDAEQALLSALNRQTVAARPDEDSV